MKKSKTIKLFTTVITAVMLFAVAVFAAPSDGVYTVSVTSSSSMFNVTNAVLTVADGKLSAIITLSGTGYSKLYMGTAEAAGNASESDFISFIENEAGEYTYTIPVTALDMPLDVAAFSTKKEIWYDRTLTFESSSLTAMGASTPTETEAPAVTGPIPSLTDKNGMLECVDVAYSPLDGVGVRTVVDKSSGTVTFYKTDLTGADKGDYLKFDPANNVVEKYYYVSAMATGFYYYYDLSAGVMTRMENLNQEDVTESSKSSGRFDTAAATFDTEVKALQNYFNIYFGSTIAQAVAPSVTEAVTQAHAAVTEAPAADAQTEAPVTSVESSAVSAPATGTMTVSVIMLTGVLCCAAVMVGSKHKYK